MIQQINLYQEDLEQGGNQSLVNKILFSFIAVTLLLAGFSLYLFITLNNTKDNIQLSKQQLIEAETRVQLLQVKYPRQQISSLLSHEISRSENIRASLTNVLHILKDKKSDQTQGFSRYFSALARQSLANVWLSTISINAQQQTLTLEGSSYQPKNIPLLLQSLHDESVFHGTSFVKLIITQNQQNNHQVDFTVSTSNELEDHD